jgi:GNAT superfamily N-acetyltransferase
MRIRVAAAEDYDGVVGVVDSWWGREISAALPRLFLDHFWATSRVAEDERGLAAFLVGFVSPSCPQVGYVHFVGVRPDQRKTGLARELYERFAQHARQQRCTELKAITASFNTASIRFHRRLGFAVSEPIPDYDRRGQTMVVFGREVGSGPLT